MSPPSLDSGPIRIPSGLGKPTESARNQSSSRRRAVVTRMAVASCSASVLLVLLVSAPHRASPVRTDPSSATALAERALSAIDVTTVLIAVAALTIVAVLRKLPYGIGAVIACTIGAVVTGEVIREAVGLSLSSTDLPYGPLVAVAALLGAGSMVAGARWRPVVLGLGTVATFAVAAAAMFTGAASIIGVVGALSIAFVWWPACSIVMLYSADAAAREARNPLDTAAMAVQRKTGRTR
ncbi:hypothetical protein [Rhodococcus sp. KRD162]|uniref:hypothetical protein n=2 Tax=unclassified Rhodococcus (in: high G+C Gram-positive bacteria) TaxID=192944 RepID=UPI0019D1650F|nr:hypothetical protein [Rhodococcus sp. KRD162]